MNKIDIGLLTKKKNLRHPVHYTTIQYQYLGLGKNVHYVMTQILLFG